MYSKGNKEKWRIRLFLLINMHSCIFIILLLQLLLFFFFNFYYILEERKQIHECIQEHNNKNRKVLIWALGNLELKVESAMYLEQMI